MGKAADKYLKIHPWEIVEEGFDPSRARVSESVFSLANEYMGVRGFFDEGYGGDQLTGSYFNSVFETESITPSAHYKGMVTGACFMINTVNWLYTRVHIDGEQLDISKCNIRSFVRRLDMKKGTLSREFIWETVSGKTLKIGFERFLSMTAPKLGFQRVTLEPLDFSGTVRLESGLDFSPLHESKGKNYWTCRKKSMEGGLACILAQTEKSGHRIVSSFRIEKHELDKHNRSEMYLVKNDKYIGFSFDLALTRGMKTGFDKIAVSHVERDPSEKEEDVWDEGIMTAHRLCRTSCDDALLQQAEYWENVWENSDIVIEGDPENQQGIRYCIFQMHQTYRGGDPGLNIGAKGLTGEAYNGNAFWDTETYCLPFYMFNNPKAARNLLEYRYKTLPGAIKRARQLDCEGAFYPIATLDGSEACPLWQHASLQLQASTGVAYGIWHYMRLFDDTEFLYGKGAELLVQISRMLATRGQWSQVTGKFGFYAVMGPDEFQMMVNNNCYTNFMGKKTFEYTLRVLEEMRHRTPELFSLLAGKTGLKPYEPESWRLMADGMEIPFDTATGIFEQHEGFFRLPHIDVDAIPVGDFPLYNSWSYDRIYRNDMIKQPDVLMFLFLYNQSFTEEIKRINYEYYEPRCIHESSLSPSIHSIFAAELGKHSEAFDFFSFATRMDLDNYNRNTGEGLHITSIAAAWMNIVYGFGGMRSDGRILAFSPSIPKTWEAYSFNVLYRGTLLKVCVNNETATFTVAGGKDAEAGGNAAKAVANVAETGSRTVEVGGKTAEISGKMAEAGGKTVEVRGKAVEVGSETVEISVYGQIHAVGPEGITVEIPARYRECAEAEESLLCR